MCENGNNQPPAKEMPDAGSPTPTCSTVEVCHICQSEFSDETTPGEFCYRCCQCDHLVCTACSDNVENAPFDVLCDECANGQSNASTQATSSAPATPQNPQNLTADDGRLP